jgi:hypothetical protein
MKNSAGTAEKKKRRQAKKSGGNSCSPHAITTKLVPQIAITASARKKWDHFMGVGGFL